MAKEKKLVQSITSRDEDFAQWYTDVVREAKLCDYSGVKGCLNYLPNGYALWENIQADLDRRFKETGVENVISSGIDPGESAPERKRPYRGVCSRGGMGDARRNGAAPGALLYPPHIRDSVLRCVEQDRAVLP